MKKILLTIIVVFITGLIPALSAKNLLADAQHGFIENKGQVFDQNNEPNPSVLYLFNGRGLNLQVKSTGFSYDTYIQTESGDKATMVKRTGRKLIYPPSCLTSTG